MIETSKEKLYFTIYPPPPDIDAWAKEQTAMAETGKCNGKTGCHNYADICD